MRRLWWHPWFEGPVADDAEALRMLLTRICQKEMALACHLADRARAVRFAPHRLSLKKLAEQERQHAHEMAREIDDAPSLARAAAPAPRPGTLTAAKLTQDLEESEGLSALYRRAWVMTSDGVLRDRLEDWAAEAERASKTIRRILVRMDNNVRDRLS